MIISAAGQQFKDKNSFFDFRQLMAKRSKEVGARLEDFN
jgi:hypothetical protein